MEKRNWILGEIDKGFVNQLEPFLPDKVFDNHSHVCRVEDMNHTGSSVWSEGPKDVGIGVWKEHYAKQVGKAELIGGLFTPYPVGFENMDKENDYLLEELKKHPECRGLAIVAPETPRDKLLKYLSNRHVVGLKPYHFYSKETPTFQSAVAGFVPEWLWEIANDKKLVILLHIVKTLAIADEDNQKQLNSMCRKYPNAKLILAHAGRGFHKENTVKGIVSLTGLQNVWFDTAAICESPALLAILKEFGPKKLLWGSDFPVCVMRGKAVTAGDGFVWLDNNFVPWEKLAPPCSPVLVGIESLLAMRECADIFGLNKTDLEDIFYKNALRLLSIEEEEPVGQGMYVKAKRRIPAGTQLLSKRPEMFAPNQWPPYFAEARGCETWDVDGRHYYDMSTNSVGACLLGLRDPDVTKAVQRRIAMGSISSLNVPEEVELANLLCEIHPWAEQVRFARCGGETGAVAIRIARATTDKSVIAVCGYHGWHDWYLAANLGEDDALRGHLLPGLNPLGVPRELRGTVFTFRYNNREEFMRILEKHGSNLAAVVMEPCRNSDPEPGFLEFVRDNAHKAGALLVFDEVTIGWRLCLGGAHLKLGVNPDIAFFAKALGNGHPIGAVIGTAKAMEGAHSSFISSTYWTEGVGPVAAIATINKMKKIDVPAHVARVGSMVKELWRKHGDKHKLPVVFDDGYPCLAHFSFRHELSEELKTLYIQLMLERGFLAGLSIYPTLAHNDEIVGLYGTAIDGVFGEIANALSKGNVKQRLKGPVAHTGFSRLL